MTKEISLNVFFSGTGFTLDDKKRQIAIFFNSLNKDLVKDISEVGSNSTSSSDISINDSQKEFSHFKMGFDGCQITHGMKGLLFGSGLMEQAKKVAKKVKIFTDEKKKVNLNAAGMSRGAIACIFLAKILATLPKDKLETRLFLFDPVPGNLFISQQLDIFNLTTANKSLDLTKSKNLTYVDAIYTSDPMLPEPNYSGGWMQRLQQLEYLFYTPVFPNFPKQCVVNQDISLGRHAGAMSNRLQQNTLWLNFYRLKKFFEDKNIPLNFNDIFIRETTTKNLLNALNSENAIAETLEPAIRTMFSNPNKAKVTRSPNGKFLNRLHEQISNEHKKENCFIHSDSINDLHHNTDPSYKLYIQKPQHTLSKKVIIPATTLTALGGFGLWASMAHCALAAKVACAVGGICTLSVLWPIALGVGMGLLIGTGAYFLEKRYQLFTHLKLKITSCNNNYDYARISPQV